MDIFLQLVGIIALTWYLFKLIFVMMKKLGIDEPFIEAITPIFRFINETTTNWMEAQNERSNQENQERNERK